MGRFNELDIEMQNLAQSFRELADAYHMNVFQVYEMLPNYLMRKDEINDD